MRSKRILFLPWSVGKSCFETYCFRGGEWQQVLPRSGHNYLLKKIVLLSISPDYSGNVLIIQTSRYRARFAYQSAVLYLINNKTGMTQKLN